MEPQHVRDYDGGVIDDEGAGRQRIMRADRGLGAGRIAAHHEAGLRRDIDDGGAG
jgi:hypothetical protein